MCRNGGETGARVGVIGKPISVVWRAWSPPNWPKGEGDMVNGDTRRHGEWWHPGEKTSEWTMREERKRYLLLKCLVVTAYTLSCRRRAPFNRYDKSFSSSSSPFIVLLSSSSSSTTTSTSSSTNTSTSLSSSTSSLVSVWGVLIHVLPIVFLPLRLTSKALQEIDPS